MNLIVLKQEDFIGSSGRVELRGRRYRHLTQIHRVEIGAELRVGLLNGLLGRGRVLALHSESAELEVELSDPPPPASPITLVLALPRPPVLRRVLITVASMGVKEIVLMGAKAVEKSYWQSHALKEDAVQDQLLLGLEQGMDTRLPRVRTQPRFGRFVDDELSGLREGAPLYIAHPDPRVILPEQGPEKAVLVVGPEAGWTEDEMDRWDGLGAKRLSLGARPLRVEAAVPALLGRML